METNQCFEIMFVIVIKVSCPFTQLACVSFNLKKKI